MYIYIDEKTWERLAPTIGMAHVESTHVYRAARVGFVCPASVVRLAIEQAGNMDSEHRSTFDNVKGEDCAFQRIDGRPGWWRVFPLGCPLGSWHSTPNISDETFHGDRNRLMESLVDANARNAVLEADLELSQRESAHKVAELEADRERYKPSKRPVLLCIMCGKPIANGAEILAPTGGFLHRLCVIG